MPLEAPVGLVVVPALLVLGFVFGLNGLQWDWWRWASWIGATVVLVASVRASRHPPGTVSGLGRTLAAAGILLVVTSTGVMEKKFSDPYGGSQLWPRALACIALTGLVVVTVSLTALRAPDVERGKGDP